jgi:ABC-2 type transport system permease protein
MFFPSQRLLAANDVGFGDAGTVRAIAAGALHFPVLTVMCMGITMMVRSLSLSMGFQVPFFFLVSPVLAEIPLLRDLAWYLPDRAGRYALRTHLDAAAPYHPATGLPIMPARAAVTVSGGRLVLRGRDA